ncbi:iron transporter [Luteipulveratus halotolerans]|uniref:Iron transporter n=2 Tax=Luteipulveratus halotolerans TaxID=1631356 RepID=A0A0L6CMA4_9MICO|nr:iron transporter [Luteipulveratus halotolerans]
MHSPSPRSRRTVALALALPLVLAGCGADVDAADDPTRDTSEVTNCGVSQSYPTPKAAVAYDVSSIEKMFALGLSDRMRGIVLPATVKSVAQTSPYKKDYAAVDTIATDVLSQEQVVSAKADWVFAGWQAGFSQERGITPDSLSRLGIQSYMQEETCFSYDKGKPAAASSGLLALDATYRDLTNLGSVFGVQSTAKSVVDGLEKRQHALQQRPARETTPTVFVYDSGTSEPYTAGRRTAPNDIITLAGGRNAAAGLDARWDVMGWEPVVQTDPDVIMVVDYDKEPLARKLAYLKNQSPLKNSKAVENNRIHVIDYGKAVSGPRNLDAAEELARYLDQQGF